MRAALISPLLAVVAVAVAYPAGARAQASGLAAQRLAPGDRVRIEVAGDSTLSGDFDVDADGWVLVPVAGLVKAVDRPFGEVASEIAGAYGREFLELPVRVLPLSRVAVLGEVTTPGLFWIDPTMFLADVLAGSGGLTDAADVADVRLQRGSVLRVISAADFEPLPLQSGDRIFVGRRSFLSRNGPILIGAGASIVAAVVTSLIIR